MLADLLHKLLRRHRNEEQEAEIREHLEIEADNESDLRLSRSEAIEKARRRFGNQTRIAEEMRAAWIPSSVDQLRQDLHYGWRSLRRSPLFTATALLSLTLGIGAATAVFSIADTVWLRPLPYREPERLAWVAVRFPGVHEFLASPDYVSWRRDNQVFEELAATQYNGGQAILLNGTEPAQLQDVRVSANFLRTFGVRVSLGRDFRPAEELPGGPRAVLLTDHVWRERFHSDNRIAGRVIRMDGEPYTIAGVLPRSFVFPIDVAVDLLTTLPVAPNASHHDRSMSTWAVYGRLRRGVTLGQARAGLMPLFDRSRADLPMMFRSDTHLVVEGLQEHRRRSGERLLLLLSGAAGCLLLIACANVSHLLLGRWSARSGELALRTALGAGQLRLTRQLLTESAVLAALAAAMGMLLATLLIRGFTHYAATELPRLAEVRMDGRALAIGLALTALTTFLFATWPARHASRIDLRPAIEGGLKRGGGKAGLVRQMLMVTEIGVSLLLMIGAALLLQTLWHLRNDGLGFLPEQTQMIYVPLQGTRLQSTNRDTTDALLTNFLRTLPGTVAAAVTECSPLSGGAMNIAFSRSDRPLPEAFHRGDDVRVCGTEAGYDRAAGIRVLRGRFLDDQDAKHPGTVAVINRTAERAYFPHEDALGKGILGGRSGSWKTIVGVVSDSKNTGLASATAPQAFVNGPTFSESPELMIIVRSVAAPQLVASAFRSELRNMDPGLMGRFVTLDQAISSATAGPRFNGLLLGSFALVALVTAALGVFGVIAFTVSRRSAEIAVRMALGAAPAQVLALVLRDGMLVVACGVTLGLAAALAVKRSISSLLYGVETTDPFTLASASILIALAALAAIWWPARRAAAIDPAATLRKS